MENAASNFQFRTLIAVGLAVSLSLSACVYRLPAPSPPTQQRIRLAAQSPQLYIVRIETGVGKEYQVPVDGRLMLDISASRRGCSVYLFDRIRISSGADPLKTPAIHILAGGKTVRTLSLEKLSSLPLDADGYYLLTIP